MGPSSSYAATTSNSTLRNHLEKAHKDEYLRVCSAKGWKNQLPSSKASSEAPSESRPGSGKRTPFSAKVFLDWLVKFIIADDQVRTVCIIFTTILISLSL
jgi:hypothetical protein